MAQLVSSSSESLTGSNVPLDSLTTATFEEPEPSTEMIFPVLPLSLPAATTTLSPAAGTLGAAGADAFDLAAADSYARFPARPLHIARVWDRYSNNSKYFGGVVSFSEADMRRINGYPNTFWGWGGEDDEMQNRLETLGIKWDGPDKGTIVDLEGMDLHTKLGFLKQNKEWKCMVKWEALEEHAATWRTNGLKDLSYEIHAMKRLDQEDGGESKVTKLTTDVKLNPGHWANEKCGVDYLP